MKDKQSKKVVIINDISSDTIERAILILKDAGDIRPGSCDGGIVGEAQNIINSYIHLTEKNRSAAAKRRSHPSRKIWITFAKAGLFMTAGYFIIDALCKIVINI